MKIEYLNDLDRKISEYFDLVEFIQDSIDSGFWFWNKTTNQVYFSKVWKTMLGFDSHEIPNELQSFWDLLHPGDIPLIESVFHNILLGNQAKVDFKFRMLHKDGSFRWIHSKGSIVADRSNDSKWLLGIHIDITKSKELELELKCSNDLIKKSSEIARIGYFSGDLVKSIYYWSDAVKEIHEVDKDYEVNIEKAISFFSPEHQDRIRFVFRRLLNERIPYDETLLIKTARNNEKWIRVIGSGEFEDDRCIKVFGLIREVTKDIEKEKLTILSSGNNIGSWEWNLQTDDIKFTENYNQILGKSNSEKTVYSYQEWRDSIHPEDINYLEDQVRSIIKKNNDYYESEYRVKDSLGNWIWFYENGTVIERQPDNSPKIVFGIFHNIDVYKRRNEEFQRLSESKSKFLSSMSHEIRTPLNGVIGYLELLNYLNLPDDAVQTIENAQKSGRMLLDIVNDILDYSKLESNKLELDYSPVSLREIVYEIIDLFRNIAYKKDLELISNIDPELPPLVKLDSLRIKQVLMNLMSNAVKFTNAGEIELNIDYKQLSNLKGRLIFHIVDTGVGIESEKIQDLFKEFSQVYDSNHKSVEGYGLGLYISNSLVKKMGGRIQVESEKGKGSDFFFSLVVDVVPEVYSIKKHQLSNLKIAIFETNEKQFISMRNQMKYFGIENIYRYSSSNYNLISNEFIPDAIVVSSTNNNDKISDIEYIKFNMMAYKNMTPKIIYLSSLTNEQLKSKNLSNCPIRAILLKPFRPEELFFYLLNLNNDLVISSKGLPKVNTNIIESYFNICIVDDNEMNLQMMRVILSKFLPNSVISIAKNGEEVVYLFKSNVFDFIFMDVQMPILNGYEATNLIRQIEASQSRPRTKIIGVSAGVMEEEVDMCYECGMDDFLAKPIEIQKLLSKFR